LINIPLFYKSFSGLGATNLKKSRVFGSYSGLGVANLKKLRAQTATLPISGTLAVTAATVTQ
jgi:hypothetical protein